jgi:transposase
MYGFPTVVKVKYRVLCCNFCGCTATEKINFKADGFNVSKRLEKVVIDELEQRGSIKDTASRYNLGWDTCKDIHKRYLQKIISFNLEKAKILAIDEFSIKRGHKYATVVVDLETKRVIWVGEGKSISQAHEFFRLCGDEGCKQIEAVAMVQNAGFATCVKKHCPKALVVYDLFHIIYNYGRLVISAIRIRLSSDKKIKDDKDGYSLLKNHASFY